MLTQSCCVRIRNALVGPFVRHLQASKPFLAPKGISPELAYEAIITDERSAVDKPEKKARPTSILFIFFFFYLMESVLFGVMRSAADAVDGSAGSRD